MEYAEGGELFNYINEKGYLTENESRGIFQQIIDGIYYLHNMGICHRDLKPENILFDSIEMKRIKIIDFGLSNLYTYSNSNSNSGSENNKELLKTDCGSPGYAPPEMIFGMKYDGLMTDIWSCGIILYAMLFGCLPFDDYEKEKLYLKIIEGKYEYPEDIIVSKEAKNLIDSILVVNPKYRADITQIKKNKWFLKNYKQNIGLYNTICEIPVSDLIVKEMVKMGYNKDKIINNVKNNNHNNLTTLYYLLVKQKLKIGIETESDLISNSFKEYMKKQYSKLKINNMVPISLKEMISLKEENTKKSDNYKQKVNNSIINIFRKEFNKRNINSRKKIKNKSKEKKGQKYFISKININNIKNIHYININNIKSNILAKTFDYEKNNKLYSQVPKNKKEISNSNSKNKMKNSQNMNIHRKNIFINLNYFNNKKNFSRQKKIKLDIKNKFKNNKTIIEDSAKDINISMSNNINRNNFTFENSKIMNNKTKVNKKIFMNKLLLSKLPTYNNYISRLQSNNNFETAKEKRKDNYFPFLFKKRMKKLEIGSIYQLLNNFKTSKPRRKKFNMYPNTNSKSKASSNSVSRSKCNNSKENKRKRGFFITNKSRNYLNENSTKNSKLLKNITNENLNDSKNLRNITLFKDKNALFKGKSKFKLAKKKSTKESSKHKNIPKNIDNKKGFKMKQLNNLNSFINKNNKNIIQRNNTSNFGNKKIYENKKIDLSIKNDKSINISIFLKNIELKNKDLKGKQHKKNLNNKIKDNIQYSFNTNEKFKEKINQNILENNSNTISNSINNINTFETYSREINDISNPIKSSKIKNNICLKKNAIQSNKNINRLPKKIKMNDYKPLKLKKLMLLGDLKKPHTYRKNQKFMDEYIFQ